MSSCGMLTVASEAHIRLNCVPLQFTCQGHSTLVDSFFETNNGKRRLLSDPVRESNEEGRGMTTHRQTEPSTSKEA